MLRVCTRTIIRRNVLRPVRPLSTNRTSVSQIPSLHTFTEEEEMLRESVRRFAVDEIAPRVREMDENESMSPEIIKGLFDQGLMGIETSTEFGGSEFSFTAAVIAIEELAKIDPAVSVMCDVHNTLVNTIFRIYGTHEQQEKYLTQLAQSKMGSFCLSESASGSDAFALQTRAEKKSDHYVLNGSKMWITNSLEAEIFLVFATIDPSKGYKGITCFIVEKDMGVQVAKKEQKLGIRASSTCTLNFDDVKVPVENVIGGEGNGYKVAIQILNEGRIGIAGQMVGLAQGAFDKAVPYTLQRKQFGRAVGEFQGMQFQQAEAAVQIEAARLLTYNAARRKEEGRDFVKEAAMAKYYSSIVAQRVSGAAIEWAGGVGFTRETGIEKFWRDSKIGAIYEGTSNIQLQTIAKFIQKDYLQTFSGNAVDKARPVGILTLPRLLSFNKTSSPSEPQITFQVKDVLIEGNKIIKVDESIQAPANAVIIDARNHIVSPGFIDTHRHLWQAGMRAIVKPKPIADQTLMEYMCSVRTVAQPLFTAEEMHWSQLVGACEAVVAGVTTVLDQAQGSQSPAHVERAIDATRLSGLRSIYAYFRHEAEPWNEWGKEHILEIGRKLREENRRITLGLGYDPIAWESPEDIKNTLAIADEAGSHLTTVHFVNTHYARSFSETHKASGEAFNSNFVLSHFNHAVPEDWELVQKLGLGIACTPETELAMSHGQCALFDCAEKGVKAGLGVDTHIVCSGDMFGQMRLALQSARSIRNARLFLGPNLDQPPPRVLPRRLIHKAEHMLRFATLGGAETLNMADKIGSIDVGKLADIILISLSSPNMLGTSRDSESLVSAIVAYANVSDIKTVIIDGEIVKRDGELTKVKWSDVVEQFQIHHAKVETKIKEASLNVDWEEAFEALRESWFVATERIAP